MEDTVQNIKFSEYFKPNFLTIDSVPATYCMVDIVEVYYKPCRG